jgi:phytoene desaturase
MSKSVGVIGAGFSGLAAAATLAQKGFQVEVFEKNQTIGGRARKMSIGDFHFDMGPSWYWMPDVFERFFAKFGKKPEDYYKLIKLDPAFRVFFNEDDAVDVPGDYDGLKALFEQRQPGSSSLLDKFMDEAEFKYKVGMDHLVYKPSESWLEFATPDVIKGALRLDVFTSLRRHVRKSFKDPALVALMEFPVLFLGAMPDSTPALYSLMNYAGFKVGTFYPMGGFSAVVDAMRQIAEDQGVIIHTDSPVRGFDIDANKILGVQANGHSTGIDGMIGAADYHHIEQDLLPATHRRYSSTYWKNRTLAPSCLLFYLGIDKPVEGLEHHNLFFDADLDKHAKEIYSSPKWPTDPLFYVSAPSKTDPSVAPKGKENVFILMPLAPGLEDTPEIRKVYFDRIMDRIESKLDENIKDHITVYRDYCINDFISDYNSLRGNAYGLANTLRQTAVLKPRLRPKKLKNMFFAGHLTVPGPGVPPSIISGQIAAEMLTDHLNSSN